MNKQTVLIVEDDELLRSLLKETVINSCGHCDVIDAENGLAALHILEKEKVDLVLSDIKMPVMDGVQLLSELYNRKIWLPIIILTAHGARELENKLDEFGIVDYLAKPIDFRAFRDKLKEMLERQSRRDQVSGMSLATILQILEMEQKTGVVHIRTPEREGRIFFRKGVITDIDSGGLSPEEALGDLMDHSIGDREITIQYINHRRRNVVNKSLTEILLDAARILDESHFRGESSFRGGEAASAFSVHEAIDFQTIKDIFDLLKRDLGEGFLAATVADASDGRVIAEIGSNGGSEDGFTSLWRNMRASLAGFPLPSTGDLLSLTFSGNQAIFLMIRGDILLGLHLEMEGDASKAFLLETLPGKIRGLFPNP